MLTDYRFAMPGWLHRLLVGLGIAVVAVAVLLLGIQAWLVGDAR